MTVDDFNSLGLWYDGGSGRQVPPFFVAGTGERPTSVNPGRASGLTGKIWERRRVVDVVPFTALTFPA